jgi:hypothetical protein
MNMKELHEKKRRGGCLSLEELEYAIGKYLEAEKLLREFGPVFSLAANECSRCAAELNEFYFNRKGEFFSL